MVALIMKKAARTAASTNNAAPKGEAGEDETKAGTGASPSKKFGGGRLSVKPDVAVVQECLLLLLAETKVTRGEYDRCVHSHAMKRGVVAHCVLVWSTCCSELVPGSSWPA